jgi:hypothetical protein
MEQSNIAYYVIVFLNIFNENVLDKLLNLDQVNYISFVHKPSYPYNLQDLVKYLELKETRYKWKVHSLVRHDVSDEELVDSILDTNYNQSKTNHLIISKKPNRLSNDFVHKSSELIANSKFTADLFGAVSSETPYDLFCTPMSLYLSVDKNRDQDVLSKIKDLDRKIYEV